jgi:hypothetical protein
MAQVTQRDHGAAVSYVCRSTRALALRRVHTAAGRPLPDGVVAVGSSSAGVVAVQADVTVTIQGSDGAVRTVAINTPTAMVTGVLVAGGRVPDWRTGQIYAMRACCWRRARTIFRRWSQLTTTTTITNISMLQQCVF